MAHDITATDGMVLVGQPAWHGLGRVVEQAPTPLEALKLAKLDWTVEQWPLSTTNGEVRQTIDTHVCNVRSDTKEQLGIVGEGYSPIQNVELAEFATALAEDADVVRIESAASICGGRKVWFLLRGQSFTVKGFDDRVNPYILLANAHDGSMALHVKPTSVRVVCRNTLNMALGGRSEIQLRIKHEGDVKDKITEAKRVLGLYRRTEQEFEEKVNALAARTMTHEELQRFFLEAYAEAFEPIPAEAKTEKARKQIKDAHETVVGFGRVWDRERHISGENLWTALNAVTGWCQNVDHVRGADQRARNENRLKSKLFGTIEDRTDAVAKLAMASV